MWEDCEVDAYLGNMMKSCLNDLRAREMAPWLRVCVALVEDRVWFPAAMSDGL